MEVTEYERHQLFVWFEEHMGPERAATMMNLTKQDLQELDSRLDAKFDRFEARMTSKFVTWLLASQATTIAVVSAVVALR